MINKKPSRAVEKEWLQRVAEHGCVVTGQSNIQIHHCMGREAKNNKYYIGRWFVLPIAFELHDVSSNHPLNITHHRKAFIAEYGTEGLLFYKMCLELGDIPFEDEVMNAILATGR